MIIAFASDCQISPSSLDTAQAVVFILEQSKLAGSRIYPFISAIAFLIAFAKHI